MSWSRAPLPPLSGAIEDWPDLMLLAATILGEAEGEPFDGQLAVGWVIVNRAEDARERWPQTIGDLCLQPHQFSAWRDERRRKVMLAPKIHVLPSVWDSCFKAAAGAMFKLARDPVRGANHYHAIGVEPVWAKNRAPLLAVKSHIFYRW